MKTHFAVLALPVLGWVSATLQAQSVSIVPTVSPSAVPVGTPSVLTVGGLITSPPSTPLISNSVNLLQVDQFGNALSVVGSLNDSGVNGDLIAGDGIFGGKFAFTEASTGLIYLRISAAFRGQLRRSLSSLFTVQVVSASVPTTLNPFNINTVVTDPVSNTQVVCNELLTSFVPGTPLNTITATAASVGGTIAGWLPALDVYQIGFSSCDVSNLNAAISVLQSQSIVTTAQKNGIVQLDTVTPFQPNDPLFQQQWNLSQIQAPYAWALTQTGAAIGIIDTGVDFNHEDLEGNVVAGLDQCASVDSNGNCVYGSGSLPMDTFGHGTGTASVAGAITNNGKGMAGAAFDVQLIAEKVGIVINGKFYGTYGAAALGIVDAVNLGARVINLSFGGGYPIDLAVQYAYTKNRVVVAGAGNSNDSTLVTPAAYPNVISVGASDENNARANWVQECPNADLSEPASNYGSWVNIYAPGANIVYASLNGGYGTLCQAGTSWATPHVSATASLMLSVNPSLTPDQVKLIIMSSALNTGHTDTTGGNPIYLLNMFNAVQMAKNQSFGGVGAVVLSATLDGNVWGGSVTVGMNSISLTSTVPTTLSDQQPGSYGLEYSSGGPPNSTLVGVMPCGSGTPSCTEPLAAGEVLTFILQFKSNAPTAGFTMAASGQSENNGQTLNLTVEPGGTANVSFDETALSTAMNGATISRYQWTLDGSVAANTSSFSRSLAAGTHTVSLVVTDSRGVQSQPATGTVVVVVTVTHQATFTAVGNMTASRANHTATLLSNGQVLIAGGVGGTSILASAELYDPIAGTFSVTGSMHDARQGHTATLLPDGRVLVTGGDDNSATAYTVATAEIYDPSTGTFTVTGNMTTPRMGHAAVLLTNGKVLIMGGQNFYTSGILQSTELYDPAAGSFTAGSNMTTPRSNHAATRLSTGNVLITGGEQRSGAALVPLATAEVYVASTGTFTPTGTMTTWRVEHTAILLSNGEVLLAGGNDTDILPSGGTTLASAELYDPTAGVFTMTGSMAIARGHHTATELPDGTALIVGGIDLNAGVYSLNVMTEVFSLSTALFAAGPDLNTPRYWHTATLLLDGRVLVTGGFGFLGVLASAELW